jgi:hypothetical protein
MKRLKIDYLCEKTVFQCASAPVFLLRKNVTKGCQKKVRKVAGPVQTHKSQMESAPTYDLVEGAAGVGPS